MARLVFAYAKTTIFLLGLNHSLHNDLVWVNTLNSMTKAFIHTIKITQLKLAQGKLSGYHKSSQIGHRGKLTFFQLYVLSL